ncbi:hypothetical protein FCL47_22455 [Desulfopila sp. IMCC35006]|uniref:hypothetical protein n=1 Tax=Desulfopila sp. IMCC35006 TaxID=2569542 RepID=UPI0010AC8598|nr:hypothetical protein [Desulfopila sp. IMCC35006]TKB23517.1 hypothetical protein FCL47_22455 [Desulfopila sp. IMCC35006]
MSFTLRTEEKHEIILNELCRDLELGAKSKAVLWLIENIQEIQAERSMFFQNMTRLEREIKNIKCAIQKKTEAELELTKLCSN